MATFWDAFMWFLGRDGGGNQAHQAPQPHQPPGQQLVQGGGLPVNPAVLNFDGAGNQNFAYFSFL